MNLIKKLFDYNEKEIARYRKRVEKINALADVFYPMSDGELREKATELRDRVANGETLDSVLDEAFALVREAADRRCFPGGVIGVVRWEEDRIKERIADPDIRNEIRKVRERLREDEPIEEIFLDADFYEAVRAMNLPGTRMRPFDMQLVGGMVLNEGKIAEMKTGEGKTLVSTLPCFLNALTGRGVHVVTVNDYLAKRDSAWMGSIHRFLGLSVGVILHEKEPSERREAYNSDVTYGTNNEFGFDYLRDNMAFDMRSLVQREHYYAVVDEVDSILVDEARTPLIISGRAATPTVEYERVARAVASLVQNESLFNLDEKEHASTLTEEGVAFMEKRLGVENLYAQENTELNHIVNQSLKAQTLFKLDRDYVVQNNEVIIVDEFTGRLMHGRRYSDGLHQSIEAKEGVKVEHESQTLASITFQNYFRMYKKLSGMTGTAKTEEQEFIKIYNLPVVVIPTNRPMVRKDHPDIIYKTERAKFKAVIDDIVDCFKKGQPCLVGTVSIEKSERLSAMLQKREVPHTVLNAKHHEKEAEIVAQAGRRNAVTIATNMAGRGTDIVLGEGVKDIGGLFIIGTERHEARRIDNQLRGRSGRQGDSGESRFYISLEDDLMRLFGSDRIGGIMERFGFTEEEPIEHRWISKSIENAQKKVEGHNFEIRKHVLNYDDVMNKQRETIYRVRRETLEGKNIKERTLDFIRETCRNLVEEYANPNIDRENWDLNGLYNEYRTIHPPTFEEEALTGKTGDEIADLLERDILAFYEEKERRLGEEIMRKLEQWSILRANDEMWIDHLDSMDSLREGIGLRAYGQVDPLNAYKKEAWEAFQSLVAGIRRRAVRLILAYEVVRERVQYRNTVESRGAEEGESSPQRPSRPAPEKRAVPKVGRNDPCPCGSGKKYKKCCGSSEGGV